MKVRGLTGLLTTALAVAVLVPVAGPAYAADPRPPRPVTAYSGAPEPSARYVPQVSCDPTAKPGTVAVRDLLKATYGGPTGGIGRSCDAGVTEHSEGRAYDWTLDAGVPADAAKARSFISWLTGPDAAGVAAGNARRLGVMYVIWDRQIWGSYNGRWKPYSGSSPHRDHVHISLSWDGAMKRTSFWTGRTLQGHDYGPCRRHASEAVPVHSGRNLEPCPAPASISRSAVPLVGDWDGDGRDEQGWFDSGSFLLRDSRGKGVRVPLGRPGDLPVVGDWDGDGRDTVGVFRRGTWYLLPSHSPGVAPAVVRFGSAGDRPVVGSWDGRQEGVGVYRRGTWFLRDSWRGGSTRPPLRWGSASMTPLAGDWDGDGDDTPGLAGAGRRHMLQATTWVTVFGRAQDAALAGDFDGDGRTTHAVVHGTSFLWRDDLRTGPATASTTFG